MSATGSSACSLSRLATSLLSRSGVSTMIFCCKIRLVVRHQSAKSQGRIEAIRLDRLVVIDDRVARRWPRERRLRDWRPGEGIEQRRFADAGSAHQHDDEQRAIDIQRLRLPAEVVGHAFERRPSNQRDRLAMRVHPASRVRRAPVRAATARACATAGRHSAAGSVMREGEVRQDV